MSTISETDLQLLRTMANPDTAHHDARSVPDTASVVEARSEAPSEGGVELGGLEEEPEPEPEDEDRQPRYQSDSTDDDAAKQELLMELARLRAEGVQLSRDFTMDDRLEDMEFEVRRQLLHIEETNTVKFMQDIMKLGLTAIEFGNARMGPILELDGWANEASRDIDRYNDPMRRLYRKYWKRTSMGPEMEIAMGVMTSMGSYHFRKRFVNRVFQPERVRRPPRPPSPDSDDEDLPPPFA